MLRAFSSEPWSRVAFAACTAVLACAVVVICPVAADERVERDAGGSHRERYDASLPAPVLESRGVVHAGQSVTIRWRAMRSVEECELLLSIDGGRTFPLRISPEIEGLEDRYVWRVPNLNAFHARIRLRARVEGREVEGPVGTEFAMVADPEQPPETWLFREEGDLEDVEREIPRGSLSRSGGAEIHPTSPSGAVLRPEDPEAFASPVFGVVRWKTGGDYEPRSAAPPQTSLSWRFVPLRE